MYHRYRYKRALAGREWPDKGDNTDYSRGRNYDIKWTCGWRTTHIGFGGLH